jgi:hypothetical protein
VFAFSTEVTLLWGLENHLETCFLPIFCSPKLLSSPGKFQYHFPVKAKFDADMSKSRMEQHTPVLMQPCSKLEVTQQTTVHQVVEVHVCSIYHLVVGLEWGGLNGGIYF